MSYSPPAITSAGLSVPSFTDILNDLIAQFQIIYGAAVSLGVETDDYQLLASFSAKIADCMLLGQLVYNQRGPATASGAGLDSIVKLNGIARKGASFSSCVLTVIGAAGTIITNGIAQDINGVLWDLPSPTTIVGGSIMVTAICETIEPVTANIGDIQTIATPTAGWVSVTNGTPAAPGLPIELDSQLRARQAISVAGPSETPLAGTIAAVAAVANVTRSVVYENYYSFTSSYGNAHTSSTTAFLDSGFPLDSSDVGQPITINSVSYTISAVVSGTQVTLSTSAGTQTAVPYFVGNEIEIGPPHSITAVVEGGLNADIAQAIYSKKGIGAFPNGTTSVVITDPTNDNISQTINFDRPTYVSIYVGISVHGFAGFTSATASAIQSGIASYLASLSIGEAVVYSELYGKAALTARPNPDEPLFSIRALTSGLTGGMGLVDVFAPGSAYTVGDVLTVVQAGASGGTVTIASIVGLVTLVTLTTAGTGYVLGSNLPTTGGTGTGLTINIIAVTPAGTTDIVLAFNQAALSPLNNTYVKTV